MKKLKHITGTCILIFLLLNAGWRVSLHAQNGWERMTDMPTSRSVLKSVEHNGKIYVIGGDNAIKKYEKCNEVYDIETDEWTIMASMDSPRVGHTLEILNNKLYVVGGVESVQQNFSNILEYDIETDKWITKCDMPEPRFNHFSEVIDGKIYIAGGFTVKDGRHPGVLSTLRYDPAKNQWDTLADLNHERHLAGSCIFDDKIYVFGGAPSGIPIPMAHRSIEIYDPEADAWTISDDEIPVPFMYGVVVAHGDNILLFGGYEKVLTAKCYNSIYKYVPASSDGKWKAMASMPEDRARMSGNIVNNFLHMLGGIVGIENAESMTDFSAIFPADNHWRLDLDSLNEHVFIPDTAFHHALIDEGVDINGDSLISYSEAEAVNSLNVEGGVSGRITDLSGIQAFINLDTLYCSRNLLSSLDVSACTRLRYLECGDSYGYLGKANLLTNLDLRNNTALTYLDCSGNYINNLNLSNNAELKYLLCTFNEITSLDLAKNSKLALLCSGINQLASLNVTKNSALKSLSCYENQLTSLDVSNNPELTSLSCGENQLTNLDISNNTAITSLGLTNMPNLFEVCVWTLPFPPDGNYIDITDYGSPNIYFTTECSDYISPYIIDTDTQFLPDSIAVSSSEDGMIYLVPQETDKDILAIRGASIDSVEAIANTSVSISLSGLDNGLYWLYARDSTGNISGPEAFSIFGVSVENDQGDPIELFPNPTSKLLTITIFNAGLYTIEISSLNGQKIFSKEVEGTRIELDISSFQKGIYFISIRSKDFVTTRKIIKM
jgi:N-acetylneuraminic acid mutarotase